MASVAFGSVVNVIPAGLKRNNPTFTGTMNGGVYRATAGAVGNASYGVNGAGNGLYSRAATQIGFTANSLEQGYFGDGVWVLGKNSSTTTFLRGLSLAFNEGSTSAAQGLLRNVVADGSVVHSGGTTATDGGNVVCYGSTHATLANTCDLRVGSTVIARVTSTGVAITGVSSATGGYKNLVSTANTANPPTNAELISAFGAAATTGAGFTALLDDNNGHANEYLIWSDGTKYWYATGTAAP